MIKKLTIRNFKSIKDAQIECARINIFIGKPNVGKSNILESLGFISSLLYYQHSSHQVGLLSSDFVRFDSLLSLFYNNNPKEKIEILYDRIELKIETKQEQVKFLIYENVGNDRRMLLDFTMSYHAQTSSHNRKQLIKAKTKLPNICFYRFKPLWEFPSKEFSFLLPPFGKNLMTIIQSNPEIQNIFKDLLEPYGLNLIIKPDFNTIEVYKVISGISISFSLKTIADTFLHLIQIISALKSTENSILVFEEPETHLFPFYSTYLARMMVLDKLENQYFISTHNPYFLSSLVDKTPKEDIRVFIVYYEDQQTKIHSMTQEEMEKVLDWDNIFFNLEKYMGN